jgi:hypothetical protein
MWYHPAAFFVDKRDIIDAWLICVVLATAFFGYPAVTTALDTRAGDRPTATAGRHAGALIGWQPVGSSERLEQRGAQPTQYITVAL